MTKNTHRSGWRQIPGEWKLAIILLLSSLILMSGFLDSLVIQIMGYPEVPRSIRIASALFLSSLVGLAAIISFSQKTLHGSKRRPRPWELPLGLMVFLMPVWMVIGLVNQWPITYIAGDIFMLGILPATYFVLIRRPLRNLEYVFKWLYGLMIFAALMGSALVLYNNLYLGYLHKISMDAASSPILYIMLKSTPGFGELSLAAFLIISAALSTKRSSWLAILIAITLAIALRPGTKRFLRILSILLLLLASIFLVYRARPELIEFSANSLERRWNETVEDFSMEDGSDLALDQGGRAGEVIGVVDTIVMRQSPADWMMGMGLGAIVQARGGRLRHHIHSTPAAFLARTGIAGLFLWSWFVLATLYTLAKYARRPPTEWLRVQFLFWAALWISMMIFSLKSQAFWGSILGGIQLAYLNHLCSTADEETRRIP